jgi:hypothetical protein
VAALIERIFCLSELSSYRAQPACGSSTLLADSGRQVHQAFSEVEAMKKKLSICSLMLGVLWIGWPTRSNGTVEQGYEPATIVSVERYQTTSNYLGENPADAPLRARDYTYDIGIRLACNVYVGRYQSAINYLPSSFATNQIVDVRLQKHVLYVSVPGNDWDLKMGIVSHRRVRDESCTAGL